MECFRQLSSKRNRAKQKASTSPTTAQNPCAKDMPGSYTTDKTRPRTPSLRRDSISWRSNTSKTCPQGSSKQLIHCVSWQIRCGLPLPTRSERETSNKRTPLRGRQLRAGWPSAVHASQLSSDCPRDAAEMTASSVTWRVPHRLRHCGGIVEPCC